MAIARYSNNVWSCSRIARRAGRPSASIHLMSSTQLSRRSSSLKKPPRPPREVGAKPTVGAAEQFGEVGKCLATFATEPDDALS
jgi:hypothetical protein